MGYLFRYASVTIAALLLAQMALSQEDCALKKAKGDLKVYSCPSKDQKLNKIRTEVILENTTFERFREFVWDVENYVTWQYNTVEATILKTGRNSMVYRTVVEAPWPLSNREMFTEIESRYDTIGKKLQIITRSMNYEYPSNDDLVRVPFSEGIWDVSLLGKSSLKVVYTLTIDPGGSVPSWLLNMAIAEGPYQSFTNLKEKLSSR